MGQGIGESYYGGTSKVYISPTQIRRMKKNMKKVPRIQKKAQKYSQKELEIADEWFNKHLQDIDI